MSRRPLTLARRESRDGRLLLSPTLLVVALVVVVPFLGTLWFAFQDLRLIDIPSLSVLDFEPTLENFERMLTTAGFWTSLRTTVLYALLCTVTSVGAGLVLALAMRRPFRGRGLIRALVLIPYVLPVVAAVTTWQAVLNPQYGPVNAFGMRFLGWEEPINFLTTGSYDVAGLPVPLAFLSIVAFETWKCAPLAFLFITARLQTVSKDLEEAAVIDGASPLQLFRHVVLPELRGVLALLAVLRFIWTFQNFNDPYLLTSGAGGTEVLAIRVYNELINRSNVGTASALGLVLTVLLAGLLVAYVRMSRSREAT